MQNIKQISETNRNFSTTKFSRRFTYLYLRMISYQNLMTMINKYVVNFIDKIKFLSLKYKLLSCGVYK